MSKVKPGYKQTEVGVIPEDWEYTNVCGIASTSRNAIVGGPFGSDLVSKDYVEFGVPVIRGQNMRGQWISGDFVFVTTVKAKSLEANLAKPKDIIFTQRGTLGQVSLVPDGPFDSYLVSQSQMKLSVNRQIADSLFFYYVFTSKEQQELIRGGTIQTGVPHINLGILRDIPVQLPPFSEQEAIAEALSDADALIESLEQLLAKKYLIKQGAMQKLLNGEKRLPGFRGKWGEKLLGEIFDFYTTANNARSDLLIEGDISYVHYGDIHTRFHGHLDFSHEQLPKINRQKCKNAAFLQNGDWIIVDASEDFDGIAKAVEVCGLKEGMLAVSGLHTFLLREKTPTFSPGFKGHLRNLKSLHEQLLRVATGMKVFGVPKTALKDLRVPIPSLGEQTAIAAVLSDMDAEIEVIETKLAKSRQLKQGMSLRTSSNAATTSVSLGF